MEKKVDSKKIMLQNGVLLGLSTILIAVISYVGGIPLGGNSILMTLISVLGFAVMILFILAGMKKYKSDNGGFISLGQCLKIGLGIAVIGGLIAAFYNVIFAQYIAPDYTEQLILLNEQKTLEINPNITQEQLDMSMEMARKFSTPWMQFAFSVIGNLFFGFIISLIAGLVIKKDAPEI